MASVLQYPSIQCLVAVAWQRPLSAGTVSVPPKSLFNSRIGRVKQNGR
jgi:hypothetical protein